MILNKVGYETVTAASGAEGMMALARGGFDLVFVDLKLPDLNGLEIVTMSEKSVPRPEVIIITGFASIETAIEAIKRGAYDYLMKPLSPDKVRITAKRSLETAENRKHLLHLQQEVQHYSAFERFVGCSPSLKEVFNAIHYAAKSDSNVLITGQSGTGKELAARAVHYNSGRRDNNFVPINCAAIAKDLIESELFGSVKGAFTGSLKDKVGLAMLANGGTLFLDEIGETSTDFQAKLLRFIQEGEFRKVGDPNLTVVNVRIVAATNRDLIDAMKEGIFREDLYYRLNVIHIQMPPLSECREDIPLLVKHFIEKYAKKRSDLVVRGINDEAMKVLMTYHYPGNIRELENIIERAIVFSDREYLSVTTLPAHLQHVENKKLPVSLLEDMSLKNAKYHFERNFIIGILIKYKGNVSQAANTMDIHRQNLQQKIKEFVIDLKELRNK
ncbi:MAG: sigma-54-dependent Fis family transcriptional regulator [Nitrospirae bacterium]|nr:sigma-54-dependent Fis family transcriptional regulator [Nitrospirota bacterium]